ncbi:glycosyl transferase family 39 [Bifidobacterium sp. DSM 109958]|uniref:Glycosyl transferase family 39 n=1 Tax=Bifidobacterium moraviense TaxID=2675323 RepID=A0A7Y0F3J7_9BIFI|nr:glycosyltransferase family 39 protein [Bifidobacterium sp. DSM 109958]NMN00392.1 glycosyl transferase family 39 [Bifidobacterium sp. DSM 109958]
MVNAASPAVSAGRGIRGYVRQATAWMTGGRFVQPEPVVTVRESVAARRTRADWIGLGTLMGFSLIVMFVNLTASGYANEFYSAAAQAGSVDWRAFLWGSSDAGNSITVDKPPAAIWLMALSVRILGLSSFAILLPEAICGVISVWLVYACVRRTWGNWAGIIAGFTLATTPVAALMFRFNNPDALLVALMTGAAYAVLRSLEYPDERRANRRRTAWMALAGVLIGFGFLTKQMQVFLVLPGFALAFLVASPTGFPRRIVDGLAAVLALVVSAGWWVLLTVIVPSGSRPYIGGSQADSFLELTFGYNGLGRLTGDETGAVVGGGGNGNGGGMWGQTGITRLFDGEYGGQIAWLAPLAAMGIIAGLIVTRRARRTDVRRASVIVWGAWLLVTWLTFSHMAGIFHQYYTVALAPALAALVGIAASALWSRRNTCWARAAASLTVLVCTLWSIELLGRSTWMPALKAPVLVFGLIATVALAVLALAAVPMRGLRALRGMEATAALNVAGAASLVLAAVALAIGPVAWTAYTVSTGHQGSIVTAGPNVTNSTGMGGGPGGQGGPGGRGGMGGPMGDGGSDGGSSDGGFPGGDGGSDGQNQSQTQDGTRPGDGGNAEGTGMGGGRGGAGGLLGGGTASSTVVEMLQENADQYTWAAATTGSQNAASYQLASEQAVMPIGGFNGSDPSPTLEQFKQYVAEGRIHYYIGGGGMGGNQLGGSSAASEIAEWVAANFEAQTVDGVTIYDLTQTATQTE